MQTLSRPAVKSAAPRRRPGPAMPPVLRLIGRTPLVQLHFRPENLTIYAKVEFTNPSGSIKDRLALHLLTDARRQGLLRPDSIILECSSGNTGIS
ncbi:MAG: pyridoxal-phosphate dependent enzyme, partial [Opitutaceae bacterium]|nr:pyridoxal-phosphate dependent enzyme [Opitutaceae bacterium]